MVALVENNTTSWTAGLVKALIRMGEKERVIALYGAKQWKTSMRRFNRMSADFDPDNCI